MRVLHVDGVKIMRGGQWQTLRLIEGLAAEGVESTLLAPRGSPLFDAARRGGWRVEPFSFARTLLHARENDLVHAHDSKGHTFGAFVRGRPLLVSRRVAFPVRAGWKYARATRFLAVSEFVKSVLISGGVPAEKITVVYDGVPLLDRASGARVIALRKDGVAPSLDLTISQRLEFDLRDAAVLVYLTASEGLGSGALLAMSAGVPVVASRIGGLPEAVRHGETGLLVDNTEKSITAAIRELTADPQLARSMGEAGRRAVREQFTVEHMVRRTMEVYRQTLSHA